MSQARPCEAISRMAASKSMTSELKRTEIPVTGSSGLPSVGHTLLGTGQKIPAASGF